MAATPSPSALADAFESVLGGSAAGLTFSAARPRPLPAGRARVAQHLALLHRAHAAARAAGGEATAARLPRTTIGSDDPAVFLALITDEYTRTRNHACLPPAPASAPNLRRQARPRPGTHSLRKPWGGGTRCAILLWHYRRRLCQQELGSHTHAGSTPKRRLGRRYMHR